MITPGKVQPGIGNGRSLRAGRQDDMAAVQQRGLRILTGVGRRIGDLEAGGLAVAFPCRAALARM